MEKIRLSFYVDGEFGKIVICKGEDEKRAPWQLTVGSRSSATIALLLSERELEDLVDGLSKAREQLK